MKKRLASRLTLLQRRAFLTSKVPALAEVLRGTLQRRYIRCGKPGCHCNKGQGHGPFFYLSVTLGVGRVEQITVALEDIPIAQRFIGNYKKILKLIDKVSKINRKLLRQRMLQEPTAKRMSLSLKNRNRRAKKT
jgi:hypothetical protein